MESLKESIQERAKNKQEYDSGINERQMQSKEGKVDSSKALNADLVVTESSGTELEKHDTSSRSKNDTHAGDVDIKSVNDKEPIVEVQLTAQNNVLSNEQQHYVQSEPIYDTHLLKKVDRNTTPDSTNMCHMGEEIDQNAKKMSSFMSLLDPSFDNMTTEFSNQSLESENISLKKTVAQLQKDFSMMEGHCVNMELKYQNQALKDGQHVTPHYLPKVRESVFVKPHHVITSGSSRCSSKESYGSNDMAYNYYLEEAKIKTQDKNMNFKPSVMHTTMSNNQTSRSLPVSKSSYGMSNEVNSRVKVQSPKTRNSNKPVEPKIHTKKPGRQIVTGHRFSPNKSFAVNEKTNTPRSCLRWIPTGRIFNTVDLRWVPTGKTFTSSTTKVDCEPPNGSNKDITNPYEYDQTLIVSAVPVADAPRAVDLADSHVSTSIDQDAPSTSISSTQDQEYSLIISQGFKELPKTPYFHDDPLLVRECVIPST
uniref:Uncharacterized protein n=1 Tax=Tanacetum cinerariifolium TaxID=118510 RepID=A0A699H8V9_TANCI|nr:hypothetical protein [Tanacetum cinerariifolium]